MQHSSTGHTSLRRPLAAALVFALLLAHAATASSTFTQQRSSSGGNGTDTYAITNARIVTVSGDAIARGTVVIRDGLIAAVGANAATPADARIIDGAGLTVYPGLIDANTTLGIPAAAPSPGAGGAGGVAPGTVNIVAAQSTGFSSPNSTQPVGLQPEILATDIIRTGGDAFENARNAGITSALTAPREGIFIGQSAFINLAGETPQGLVVRSPVALHVGFTPLRTGEYPASLLGVFSAIRQTLLDARRYEEAIATYERNPRGLRRPDQDKSLAALLPVLKGEMPVVMNANTEREINRALDLAQEFKLRAIISGGAESAAVAQRLRTANVPVLLSLNFPRRTTAAAPEADPETLRLLRQRVAAPKAAAALQAAGVRFAFQSGGLTNMSDFLANAAKAVENGLAADEALRAMTLRPAEFYGVANRLGTIETGKIANLTVTRGDIFSRDRRITNVFIDGRPVELKPVTAGGASAATGASGTWSVLIKVGELPEIPITLTLRDEGGNLGGSISGELGSSSISSASLGATGEIKFNVPVTLQGQSGDAIFNGTVSGNTMRGSVQIPNRESGSFTGSRTGSPATPNASPDGANAPGTTPNATPPSDSTTPVATPPAASTSTTDLSGTWTISVNTGNDQIPGTLQLQQQGASLSGTLQSALGGAQISSGTVDGSGFRFSATVQVGGQSLDVTFNGTVSGNQMSGTVTTPQGDASFSGTRPGGNQAR